MLGEVTVLVREPLVSLPQCISCVTRRRGGAQVVPGVRWCEALPSIKWEIEDLGSSPRVWLQWRKSVRCG